MLRQLLQYKHDRCRVRSHAKIEDNLRVERKIRTNWNLASWSFIGWNNTCVDVNMSSTRICRSHEKGSNSFGYHVEKIYKKRERIKTCIIEHEEYTKPLKSLTVVAIFILLRFSYNCQLIKANY